MQEEVEQRVVTLIVNCTKLTEQELRKALTKLLEQMKSQKQSKPGSDMDSGRKSLCDPCEAVIRRILAGWPPKSYDNSEKE